MAKKKLVIAKQSLVIEAPAPEGMAPTEFCIFKKGLLTTVDGEAYLFNDDDSADVIAQWKKHGIRLHCDYEHQSELTGADIPNGGTPAAGWFDLEDREDGLYAINAEWKEPALTDLKDGTYKYFSPVFYLDSNKHIKKFKSLALTNVPRLDNLIPLAAKDTATTKETTMATAETETKVLAKDDDGMDGFHKSLDKHAERLDKHADKMDKMLDKHSKSLDKLAEKMDKHAEKAKDDDDDGDDDDKPDDDGKRADKAEDKKSEDKRAEKAACKALIDAATVGATPALTPGEARELMTKVEAKQADKTYVETYITAQAKQKADKAKEITMSNPVEFKFGPKALTLCKDSRIEVKNGPKGTAEAEIAEYTLAVCKYMASRNPESAKLYSPENVAKLWAENKERAESWKMDQFTLNVPSDKKLRNLGGE